MVKKIGLLTLLCCAVSLLFAQVIVERSNERVRIDGEVYYSHLVKSGETVYAISRAYNVTQEEILQKNPKIAEGLRAGDRIIIPVREGAITSVTTTEIQAQNPTANISGTTQKHVVRKGDTIFSIARRYQVNPNDLMSANNLPNNNIREGMELLIPSNTNALITGNTVTTDKDVITVINDLTQTQPVVQPQMQYHKVKQGETIASIASMYGVSEKILTDLNKDAFSRRGRLMTGALLEVPVVALPVDTTAGVAPVIDIDCAAAQMTAINNTYKVALLLPLAATTPTIESTPDATNAIQNNDDNRDFESFLEFYEGALLAVEDMKNREMNLELSVYDLLNQRESIMELINQDVLRQFDLIIGPIHAEDFAPVAEYARQYQLKIVSPMDSKTEQLTEENPYIFQVNPPIDYQYMKLFENIDPEKSNNVVMLYDNMADTILINSMVNELKKQTDNFQLINYNEVGKNRRDSIPFFLDVNKDNRVVIASNNEAVVTEVMAILHTLLVLQKYQITVYGLSRWRNFESIDLNYFHELNLKITLPFFVDYSTQETKNFIMRYRAAYNTEPSQFAFQGYDVFAYFLQALAQYGTHFEKCISSFMPVLLQSKYYFYHEGMQSGYRNTGSVRITYTPAYTIEQD